MPVTDIITDTDALTMTLTAEFPAPVDRLWSAFTDPRQLERFWGPPGWPATFTRWEWQPGGRVDYHMTGPQGQFGGGSWEILTIDEPRGFSVLDSFADEEGKALDGFPSMRMEFVFEETENGSRLRNTTYFTSLEGLQQTVAMGAVEGSRMAMDQLDTVLQDLRAFREGTGTQTELLTDTHVRITRLIDGPRELVWRAHHDPELLKKWLLGPEGWQLIECEVGDSFRYVWQQGVDTATRFGFEGETVLSQEPARAVTTERMIGTPEPQTINDLQLYEEDDATLLTLVIEYPDLETRDMILATGMTEGMEASYARLEATIAS